MSDSVSSVPRVLFIGNSPNLLNKEDSTALSWEGIMGELEEVLPNEWRCSEEEDYRIPLSVRAERIENYAKESNEAKELVRVAWSKWYQKVAELKPTSFVHKLIAAYAHLFDCILTTNYDYALEKSLNLDFLPPVRSGNDEIAANISRHHGKVWHIHGEVGVPGSIVMHRKTYLAAAKHIVDEHSCESWLSHFLQSEVHVCGFAPGQEELLFWYALARRMELPRNQRRKVVVYLFYRADKDMTECEVLRTLLTTYDVLSVPVQVPKKGDVYEYDTAWKTVAGYLLLDCMPDAAAREKQSARPKTVAPPAKSNVLLPVSGRKEYLVKSTTPTLQNPLRCWMNIRREKLEKAVADGADYYFFCDIEGRRFDYYYRANALEKVFRERNITIMKTPDRYSFYIEYRTGKIYATISANNPNDAVVTLNHIQR